MKKLTILFLMVVALEVSAQTFTQYATTEQLPWQTKDNWNFILCDQGRSAWGWKQNALVQVRSASSSARNT